MKDYVIRGCGVGALAVVSSEHQLGSARCGRGSSAEERRLAAVPNAGWFRYKPPHVDYRNAAAELTQRTLGPAAFHYAKEVWTCFFFH